MRAGATARPDKYCDFFSKLEYEPTYADILSIIKLQMKFSLTMPVTLVERNGNFFELIKISLIIYILKCWSSAQKTRAGSQEREVKRDKERDRETDRQTEKQIEGQTEK